MRARVKGEHRDEIHVPAAIAEFLGVEGVGDPFESEDPDLVGEMGVEASDEARRVYIEAAGHDLGGGADALVGACGAGPIITAGEAAVRLRNGAGEKEGLLEVALDGTGPRVLLHALVPCAAVAEENGHLAPFVPPPGLAGGEGGGGRVLVGVGRGGGGRHLGLLRRVGRRGGRGGSH